MINKKLGYYTVDNLEFDSKIQACIHGTKFNKQVSWNFNKEIFSNYNWQIEPTETLDQLYDKRSRQLREQYDYIIISYSGGADSHNIVSSFIRQNLHIDEIIVNTMESGDPNSSKANYLNKSSTVALAFEHQLQTIPRLKELSLIIPKTKINVLDMTENLFDMFSSIKDESWVLSKKEKLNPVNLTRFNYLYFSNIRKQFDKDKKIAVVLGVEKPRVFMHSKTRDFYLRFTDGAANVVGVISEHTKEYPNAVIEYFYWSPESTNLICKQAHVIRRWLSLHPEIQNLWIGSNLTSEIYKLKHERIYRSLLYSTWNNDWYQADKAMLDWNSEFGNWFINNYQDTKYYKVWKLGLDYVAQEASNFLKFNNGTPDGLRMFYQDHLISKFH